MRSPLPARDRSAAPAAAFDDARFYADRFLECWYRGAAHLDRDLERFITTYRVPARHRIRLCETVRRELNEGER